MKKKYYNKTTGEWYTEGTAITRRLESGALFSGVPTMSQLTEWGFEEWIDPAPTPSELLERAKNEKINELEDYDSSDNVNSFTINGAEMWLDAQKRQQLRISLDAYQSVSAQTVTKWFDGVEYTFPIATWYQMLMALEIYASEALNVTESHKAAINELETIEEVEEYDFTDGYPEKLNF